MNQIELKNKVSTCINFLTGCLDRDNLNTEYPVKKNDSIGLDNIVMEMSMFLPEFNFYPSKNKTGCSQVSIFTSLMGKRWNLKNSERLTFDQMFKFIIRHFQGSCMGKTKYAVLVVDNWDDDIANFWKPNIEQLNKNGVIIEVRMMIGSKTITYEL